MDNMYGYWVMNEPRDPFFFLLQLFDNSPQLTQYFAFKVIKKIYLK